MSLLLMKTPTIKTNFPHRQEGWRCTKLLTCKIINNYEQLRTGDGMGQMLSKGQVSKKYYETQAGGKIISVR